MIKRFILVLTSLFSLMVATVALPASSAAVSIFPTCSNSQASSSSACQDVNKVNSGTKNPVITIIKAAMEVISYIAGAAAVILVVVSAIRFVTSGGSPDAVAGARSTLTYALIGVAITVLAQTLVAFVLNKIK